MADVQISPEEEVMNKTIPEIGQERSTPEQAKLMEMNRVTRLAIDMISASEDYRDKFWPTWEEIERQVRQQAPDSWNYKEDWQTKVYVGLQAKTSETAYANLNSMIFPSERFYEIRGVEARDREQEKALEELSYNLLNRGDFYFQKDYLLEEASDIGSGFIKTMVTPGKDGINYVWRSCFDTLVDPQGGPNWENHRYWVDVYKRDISYLIEEARKSNTFYDKEFIKRTIAGIAEQARGLKQEELDVVRNIDDTADVQIPMAYKNITIYEIWGMFPKLNDPTDESKGYTLEPRVVAMVNKEFVIRNEKNEYGFIPAVPGKIKPRKYDFYGKGYLLNGRGTQELMNSMINLGFDSMKMCAFDIAVMDANMIADQSSIQYKPLATWLVKGDPRKAAMLTRQSGGVSAMSDIMNGLSLLDRIHQDVTGVTRHSEGTPTLSGKEGNATLGEFQLKLQAVDRRFMAQAKRFEEEFTKRLLKNTYRIIANPALFKQEAVDRILGFKQVKVEDPSTGQEIMIGEIPKLVLKDLQDKGEMAWDFRGSGVSQFSERQKTLEKLQQALSMALANPTLTAMTNVDVLWKRVFQVSEIPDWEEVIKTPEQIKELMDFVGNLQGGVPADGTPLDQVGPPAGIPTQPGA